MKKEEKVFLFNNPIVEFELRKRVMAAFEPCKQAVRMVADFGIVISRDVVTDCLKLRKDVIHVPVTGSAKWVGEDDNAFPREYTPKEVFGNAEHLQAELEKMVSNIEASDERPASKTAKIKALRAEFDNMLFAIYNLFHAGRRTIETNDFLSYFEVVDGEVVLPSDIGEKMKADTATYATTAKAKQAYRLHKEIAEKLNMLADIMKNVDRVSFVTSLQNLFRLGGDGNIQPEDIDYDLFTN